MTTLHQQLFDLASAKSLSNEVSYNTSCIMLLLRSLCFLALCASAADAGLSDAVSYFLQVSSGVLERKSLSFFSHFGMNLSRNRMNGRLDCDYNDPLKRAMCPPIAANPLPPQTGSRSAGQGGTDWKLLAKKCLESTSIGGARVSVIHVD